MSPAMVPIEIHYEVDPICDRKLQERVEGLLTEIIKPQNRPALEQFRFHGSTNRVYRIPVGTDGDQFVVVKLLPSGWIEARNRCKRMLRNLLYGEHDVSTGKRRVQMEIERAMEWRREGLPVPTLIQTSLPGVRVFLGLPYPTVFTIFSDDCLGQQRKLQVLEMVVQALSHQHGLALGRGKKSLIHRDPGPWNIMFDLEKGDTYWFDLEHPAEYPKMSLEALMVRAVRVFLYGVLRHLGDQSDEVIHIMVHNYEFEDILWKFAMRMEHGASSPWRYPLQRVVWRRTFNSRRLIGRKVRLCLEAKTHSR